MPTRQPGPQSNNIVSGPSGSFVVNKSGPGGSYTSLSTGKTFPIYGGRRKDLSARSLAQTPAAKAFTNRQPYF